METGGRSGDGETGAAGRGATREPFPRTGASFGTRPASGVAAAEGRVECAFAVSSRKAAIGAGFSGDPGVHWSSAKRRRTEERALRQEKTAGGGVGVEVGDSERGRLLAWQAPEQALELHCGQEG